MIFGGVAFGAPFEERSRLRDVHGKFRERDGRRVMITYHPASAMRFPEPRSAFLEDLSAVAELFAE